MRNLRILIELIHDLPEILVYHQDTISKFVLKSLKVDKDDRIHFYLAYEALVKTISALSGFKVNHQSLIEKASLLISHRISQNLVHLPLAIQFFSMHEVCN